MLKSKSAKNMNGVANLLALLALVAATAISLVAAYQFQPWWAFGLIASAELFAWGALFGVVAKAIDD